LRLEIAWFPHPDAVHFASSTAGAGIRPKVLILLLILAVSHWRGLLLLLLPLIEKAAQMSSERPIFPTLARGFDDFCRGNGAVYPTRIVAIRACHDLYLLGILGIGCVTAAAKLHHYPGMFLRFLDLCRKHNN
jgi:hypothetical protein